jgi:hypothetical protein
MNEIKNSHSGLKWFIGVSCFALFGLVASVQQGQGFSWLYLLNLVFGVVIALVFGFFSMTFLAVFIRWINPVLKKTQKRGFARKVVYSAMVFMVPFVTMAFIAVFLLHWKSAGLFVSAAISAVAVATGNEISKLYEKPRFLNNVIPSMLAAGFSMLWLFTIVQIQSLPSTVVNFFNLATQFINLGK